VRCAQRTHAELAQTGPRHPVVSRFEFPLATLLGHSAFALGMALACPTTDPQFMRQEPLLPQSMHWPKRGTRLP
jgi:hypothetical protein